jgi:protein-disulfide isomerase
MNALTWLKHNRTTLTILLAAAGIAIMLLYSYCDTACSYLKGDILGIDLKVVGIVYMLLIIGLTVGGEMGGTRMLLASGLGVEAHLFYFQHKEDVYCPFCLAFAVTLITAFSLNHDKPSTAHKGLRDRVIGILGEAEVPFFRKARVPLLLMAVLGYLFITIAFSGSVTPAYGAEKSPVPSFGKGPCQVIVFTDYFCPPCQGLEPSLEPVLEQIHARGRAEIIFVDMPVYKETPLYARYYLYAANAKGGFKDVMDARRTLFSIARGKTVKDEESLAKALNEKGVSFKPYDPKPVFNAWNDMIRKHKVQGTPSCVINDCLTGISRHTGRDEILQALSRFMMRPKAS